jgi:hypothetical protein
MEEPYTIKDMGKYDKSEAYYSMIKTCSGCRIEGSIENGTFPNLNGKINIRCVTCYKIAYDATASKYYKKSRRMRRAVIKLLGGACACCQVTFYEFLNIDHINGRSALDRATYTGKSFLQIKHLYEGKLPMENYRVLCVNCNWSLGQYGYCPHHPEIRTTNLHSRIISIP